MASHAPGSVHNFPPTIDRIDGLPDVMQIDAIEDMRKGQEGYVNRYVQEAKDAAEMVNTTWNTDAENEAYREAIGDFEREIEKRLETAGLENDPLLDRYTEILRSYSWDKIDDHAWTARADDGSGSYLPSPKMEAVEDLRNEFSGSAGVAPAFSPVPPIPAPTPPPQHPPTPVPTLLSPVPPNPNQRPRITQDEVDEARKKLAEITAKRQGGINFFSRGTRLEKYDNAKNEYQARLNALIKNELADGDFANPEAERSHVAGRLVEGYKKLQEETTGAFESTSLNKIVKGLTSGGMVKRIAMGVGLGVGVTVATTAVLASGGVLAAGAATGAIVSTRLVRGFAAFDSRARHKRDKYLIDPTSEFKQEVLQRTNANNKPAEDSVELVHADLMGHMDETTKKEIWKRRGSVGGALAVVALSSFLADLVHMGIDRRLSRGGGSGNNVTTSSSQSIPQAPPEKSPFGPGSEYRGDIRNPDGSGPDAGVKPERVYDPSVSHIKSGQGGLELLNNMDKSGNLDLTPSERAALWEKVGPELHNIHAEDGTPLTYRMPNGEWGLSKPGEIPKAGLDKIMDVHDQMSGAPAVKGGDIAASLDAAPAPTAVNPASVAEVMNSSNVTIDPSEVAGNPTLGNISHVSLMQGPDVVGRKLGVMPGEWNVVQNHIGARVSANDPLYTKAFQVNPQGYLEFKTTRIPNDTMADMLNKLPPSARNRFKLAV